MFYKTSCTRQRRETNVTNMKVALYNYMFYVIQMIISLLRSDPDLRNLYDLLYNLLIKCFFNTPLLNIDLSYMQIPSILDQQLLYCDDDNDFVKNDLNLNLIQTINDHSLIKNYNLDDNIKKDRRLIFQYIKLHDISSKIIIHFVDYLKYDLMKKLMNIVTQNDYAVQFENTLNVHVQHLFFLVHYLHKNIIIFATYPPKRFQKKLSILINYDKHWINLIEQSHYLDDALDTAS